MGSGTDGWNKIPPPPDILQMISERMKVQKKAQNNMERYVISERLLGIEGKHWNI